jgi:hypothetical protein
MVYPTIGELVVLWGLFSIIGGFFIGYDKVIFINFIIGLLVGAGFFLAIGIHYFNLLIA